MPYLLTERANTPDATALRVFADILDTRGYEDMGPHSQMDPRMKTLFRWVLTPDQPLGK